MSALVTVRAFLNPVEVTIIGNGTQAPRVVPAKAVRNFTVRNGQHIGVREL